MVMTAYRLCLLSSIGTVTAVQRLRADTDHEALAVARETLNVVLKGDPRLLSFELWEGGRKVSAERRKGAGRDSN
jgi:hypothetical protein